MADTEVFQAALARLEGKIDTLIEDVSAPPRNGQAGGLLFRVKEGEDAQEEMRALLVELRRRLEALEAAPGKAALSWWDRVGLALLGLALTGIAGLIGAHIGRGAAPGS